MSQPLKPSPQAVNRGRIIVFVLLAILLGIIVFKTLRNNPGSFLGKPAEYQLTYLPADFKLNINIEDALAIVSNPQRYRREFNQLIYDINTSVLKHVSNRMGLSDSLKAAVLVEYEKQHPYLRQLYYNDFIAIQDTTAALYESWYDNGAGSAVKVFNEIVSKYTCFLVNQILTTVIPTREGAILAKGNQVDTPCGIALGEAMQPFIKRMEERAAVEDFSRSRGLLQEKVERVIAELATMEVQDKKGISKQMQTRIWGVAVSSTDLEITAISVLKVGFRLSDYFDVQLNSKAGVVTVTLPEPVILSHEVYPKVEKLDIGWLREVEDANFNESFNLLRKEFRREALESDIMDKAKTQAVELMNTLFGPLVQSMNSRYKLKVSFKANAPDEDPDGPAEKPLD
jgi:hypothetical protein